MSEGGVAPPLRLRIGCRVFLRGSSKSLVRRRHSVLDQLFTFSSGVALVPTILTDLARAVAGEVLFALPGEAKALLWSCGRGTATDASTVRVTTPRETLHTTIRHER